MFLPLLEPAAGILRLSLPYLLRLRLKTDPILLGMRRVLSLKRSVVNPEVCWELSSRSLEMEALSPDISVRFIRMEVE